MKTKNLTLSLRGPIHGLICWYLRKCSGSFHTYQYGPQGRYVVLMNEVEYAIFSKVRAELSKAILEKERE